MNHMTQIPPSFQNMSHGGMSLGNVGLPSDQQAVFEQLARAAQQQQAPPQHPQHPAYASAMQMTPAQSAQIQMRMAQQSQFRLREQKAASQRGLGVAAGPPQGSTPMHPSPHMIGTGSPAIRPAMPNMPMGQQPHGPIAFDPQMRPVHPGAQWPQRPPGLVRANSIGGQGMPPAYTPQQQQMMLQMQHQMGQSTQVMSSPAAQRPPPPLGPPAQPIGRASPRPPHQSPGSHLQIPQLQRTSSLGPARSSSPLVQAPAVTEEPAQASGPATVPPMNMASGPQHTIPNRAATLPATSAPHTEPGQVQVQQTDGASPTKANGVTSNPHGQYKTQSPTVEEQPLQSAVARAKRGPRLVARLHAHKRQLESRMKEIAMEFTKAGRPAPLEDTSSERQQSEFDQLVSEYLLKAGYHDVDKALRKALARKQGEDPSSPHTSKASEKGALAKTPVGHERRASMASSVDMVAQDSGNTSVELRTPRDGSPIKSASQMTKAKSEAGSIGTAASGHSPSQTIGPPFAGLLPERLEDDDETMKADSEEGDDDGVDAILQGVSADTVRAIDHEGTSGMGIDSSKPVEKPGIEGKAAVSTNDLGELYLWWTAHQEMRRLLDAGYTFRPDVARGGNYADNKTTAALQTSTVDLFPMTAITNSAAPPDSAMAARIAVSSPIAAVRASSSESKHTPVGPSATPQQPKGGQPPQSGPGPITATLQQAQSMQEAQKAQIAAQQELARREATMRQQMHPGGYSFVLPNGQQAFYTAEDMRQLRMQHPNQAPQAGWQGPQGQVYMQQHAPGEQQPHQLHLNGPRVGTPGHLIHPQPHIQIPTMMERGMSPASSSAKSKRPAGSPLNGPGKKSREDGKTPTPEEHQRQALEVAARAAAHSPWTISNQAPASAGSNLSQGAIISNAHRQYAMELAERQRKQASSLTPQPNLASPMPHFSLDQSDPTLSHDTPHPGQTPATMNMNANGSMPPPSASSAMGGQGIEEPTSAASATGAGPKKTKGKKAPPLNLDHSNQAVEAPPGTATSSASSTKRKTSAKKPAKNPGGKAGGKGSKALPKRTTSGEWDMSQSQAGSIHQSPSAPPSALHMSLNGSPHFSLDGFGMGMEGMTVPPPPGSAPPTNTHNPLGQGMVMSSPHNLAQTMFVNPGGPGPTQQQQPSQTPTLPQPMSTPQTQPQLPHGQLPPQQQHPPAPDSATMADYKTFGQGDDFNFQSFISPMAPNSAVPGGQEETFFDFDWDSANFGHDDSLDSAFPNMQ